MSADNYDGGKNTGKGKSADKFELNPKFRESKGSKGADHFEHTIEGGCRSLAQMQTGENLSLPICTPAVMKNEVKVVAPVKKIEKVQKPVEKGALI